MECNLKAGKYNYSLPTDNYLYLYDSTVKIQLSNKLMKEQHFNTPIFYFLGSYMELVITQKEHLGPPQPPVDPSDSHIINHMDDSSHIAGTLLKN